MLELSVTSNIEAWANVLKELPAKSIPFAVANAMTAAADAALAEMKVTMPGYINRPVPYTLNSLYKTPYKVSPRSLDITFGFKDFAPKGTPAGKYLLPLIQGGGRNPKSTERQMQRTGLLRAGEYIVPANVTPLKLNQYGNLAGSRYVQMLSRLKAFGEQGYTANASRSAVSQAKRRQSDFFIGQASGRRGIQARVGRGPKGNPKGMGRPVTSNLKRGFHTVFYITSRPQYRATFPVSRLLRKSFDKAFCTAVQAAVEAEFKRAAIRAAMKPL